MISYPTFLMFAPLPFWNFQAILKNAASKSGHFCGDFFEAFLKAGFAQKAEKCPKGRGGWSTLLRAGLPSVFIGETSKR